MHTFADNRIHSHTEEFASDDLVSDVLGKWGITSLASSGVTASA